MAMHRLATIEWQNKQKIRASHGHSTEELLPWAKMPRLTKDEALKKHKKYPRRRSNNPLKGRYVTKRNTRPALSTRTTPPRSDYWPGLPSLEQRRTKLHHVRFKKPKAEHNAT
jgi:hypothetical protein